MEATPTTGGAPLRRTWVSEAVPSLEGICGLKWAGAENPVDWSAFTCAGSASPLSFTLEDSEAYRRIPDFIQLTF